MKQLMKILLLVMALGLVACCKDKTDPDLAAQVREEKQRREQAEGRSRTMERVAIAVGAGALILFVAGAAIGGSARRHAPKD